MIIYERDKKTLTIPTGLGNSNEGDYRDGYNTGFQVGWNSGYTYGESVGESYAYGRVGQDAVELNFTENGQWEKDPDIFSHVYAKKVVVNVPTGEQFCAFPEGVFAMTTFVEQPTLNYGLDFVICTLQSGRTVVAEISQSDSGIYKNMTFYVDTTDGVAPYGNLRSKTCSVHCYQEDNIDGGHNKDDEITAFTFNEENTESRGYFKGAEYIHFKVMIIPVSYGSIQYRITVMANDTATGRMLCAEKDIIPITQRMQIETLLLVNNSTSISNGLDCVLEFKSFKNGLAKPANISQWPYPDTEDYWAIDADYLAEQNFIDIHYDGGTITGGHNCLKADWSETDTPLLTGQNKFADFI